MKSKVCLAISPEELRMHRTPAILRRLPGFSRGYPVNLHSGLPIKEFVRLADACARRGMPVIPHGDVAACLKEGRPVLKFGKTDPAADLAILARTPSVSEWNHRNLESIGEFPQVLDLGRKTWSILLGADEESLRELFRIHRRLFIKTRTKGFAGVHGSYDGFIRSLGDIRRLSEESRDLLVSVVLDFRQIRASTPAGSGMRSDEWRHHVYRQRLVASTHAFDCDPRRTDDRGRAPNVAKARAVIEELRARDFATSYVLDTGTLADGTVAVVECNNIFASGIYENAAIRALAAAIAGE
jgi:hypothetical protein